MIWMFPLLYEWACCAIFFAPIQQQLVESVFSKYDSRELDIVRLGQFRSAQSRRIQRLKASNKQINKAGEKAMAVARALRKSASEATPNERQLRKRAHDTEQFLLDLNEKAKFGAAWQVRGIEELSESESDVSDELSSGEEEEL